MITLTPEEEAQLLPEYEEYVAAEYKLHGFNKADIMSFNQWWRAKADEANDD